MRSVSNFTRGDTEEVRGAWEHTHRTAARDRAGRDARGDARTELTRRWLDRIADRVKIAPERIFPSDELLNHVPVLLDGIAAYLESPIDEISADVPVMAKAIELGELRHAQGFSASEILKEYEILGGVIFGFLARRAAALDEHPPAAELLACAHRVFRAVSIIQQITTNTYLAAWEDRVMEREERLRGFNRTVSHELKNRMGAVVGAAGMLREGWVRESPEQMDRFIEMVSANADAMEAVLKDLLELSRTEFSARQEQRNVLLRDAVAEVVRQLRDVAASRGVSVRVSRDLPPVEVHASGGGAVPNQLPLERRQVRGPPAGEPLGAGGGGGAAHGWPPGAGGHGARQRHRGPCRSARRALQPLLPRGERDRDRSGGDGPPAWAIVRETIEGLGGSAWAEFDGGARLHFPFLLCPLPVPVPPEPDGG